MARPEHYASVRPRGSERPYQCLPLVQLVMRIANHGDQEALAELHTHRPVFKRSDGQAMLFIQFVTCVSETPWAQRCAGWDRITLEKARDALIDKFTLSSPDRGTSTHQTRSLSAGGFRSFLRAWASVRQEGRCSHPLQQELEAPRILQRIVLSQFRFACLEARRQRNPARRRYDWRVGRGALHLYMPAWKCGYERRRWLEIHAGRPGAACPSEQRRVQKTVDDYFGTARHVPLPFDGAESAADYRAAELPIPPVEQDIGVRGLAAVVADEKAERIHEQRPAIQALGELALKNLITSIFESLSDGRYDQSRIAHSFGLSKSAMSRFAGIRWKGSQQIPDLWLNVAQTLANHTVFTEMAEDAGVWQQVEKVLEREPMQRPQRGSNV